MPGNIKKLTIKQIKILQYRADGFENKEIAGKLNVSVQSIQTQLASVCKKLNAKNAVNAVVIGILKGIITARSTREGKS